MLGARFKIKAPVYLNKDSIIDHLGMNIFEDQDGVYLTMQSYIEVMTEKLGIDVTKGKSCKLPMSDDITDMELCTKDKSKQFMSATGVVGWLSATGRPDSQVHHSHLSQYMAAPIKGTLKAVMRIARYFADNKDLCHSSRGAPTMSTGACTRILTKAHARIRRTSGVAGSASWRPNGGLP